MDEKVKKTLKLMITGMAIYNVILLIISLVIFIIYCYNKKVDNSFLFILKAEIGCVLGFVVGCIGLYNMAVTYNKAMDSKDEKFTRSYVIRYSIVRLIVFCVILGFIVSKRGLGLPAGIMFALSTFGIKVGTYMVPILEKKFKEK